MDAGDYAAARPHRALAGYADHAHLGREFRALAGCTPTQYRDGWT